MGLQKSDRGITAPSFKGDGSGLTNITKAAQKLFVSTIQTGNGSSQNVAHGLGAVPAAVVAVSQDNTAAVITYGAHDATNVKVTITNAAKYIVIAWA